MTSMASPLDLLEQHELCSRLAKEHATASTAKSEISHLPANRGIYCKRLNLFYKARQATALAATRAEEAAKGKALEQADKKFQGMKKTVVDQRPLRKQHLAEMATAAAAAESSKFTGGEDEGLFAGFGTGERVQVFGLETAKDVNGCVGTIVKYEAERFVVMLDGRNKGVRIKPENVKIAHQESGGNSALTGVVTERP